MHRVRRPPCESQGGSLSRMRLSLALGTWLAGSAAVFGLRAGAAFRQGWPKFHGSLLWSLRRSSGRARRVASAGLGPTGVRALLWDSKKKLLTRCLLESLSDPLNRCLRSVDRLRAAGHIEYSVAGSRP